MPAAIPVKPKAISPDQARARAGIAIEFLAHHVPSYGTEVKAGAEGEFARECPSQVSTLPDHIARPFDRAIIAAANLLADYFEETP